MTNRHITRTGLLGLLLAGVAIPAAAQETVSPPTINPPAAAAPQPEVAPTPPPAATAAPGVTFAPQAPVVQTAPPPAPPPESVRNPAPAEGEAAERPARRAAAAPAPRAAPAPEASAPAPVAAAEPTPVPSPDVTPAPAVAFPEPAPETAVADPAPVAETDEVGSGAAWAIMGLVAAVIVGGIVFLISRRRRRVDEEPEYEAIHDEPVATAAPAYVEAAPLAAAPIAAPIVADDTVGRPWIDIGLRPVRADDALSVEVTVSNSGDAPAHDVRISTWMLNGAESSDGERGLIDARSDAEVATIDVAPGDDKSVDTTVAMPAGSATPILVAEARYPLPDGGEGRIAATFEIETNGEPDNVEARLHEVLERA